MADYIEREALPEKRERGFFLEDDFNAGWNACLNAIASIPIADVAPVRHGKWIKATGMMPPEYCGLHICSECGHYAGRKPPYGSREMLSDYCPNCGAKMDGE